MVWLSDRCTTEDPVGGASATAGGSCNVSKNINRNKKAETESKREWERDKYRKRAVRLQTAKLCYCIQTRKTYNARQAQPLGKEEETPSSSA